MALITKSDLKYNKYSWTTIPGDDSRVTGEPDSTRFSRQEGYEVIYLINKLAEQWGLTKKASAHYMEKMINEDLPSSIQSQEKVKEWIKDNWD